MKSEDLLIEGSIEPKAQPEEFRIGVSTGRDPDPVVFAFEAEVFRRRFNEPIEFFSEAYDEYADGITLLGVYDQNDTVRAVARLAVDTGNGFKSLHDAAKDPWNVDIDAFIDQHGRDNIIDLLTVSSNEIKRSSGGYPLSSSIIFAAVQRYAAHIGRGVGIGVVDFRVLKYVQRVLSIPYRAIDDVAPAPYYGSPLAVPAVVPLSECPDIVPGLIGDLLQNPVVDLRDEAVIDLTNAEVSI